MNVLRQYPAQTAQGKRSGAQLAGWQRISLIAYVFLLGVGLPFICWGNVADPTHPHKGPHFVFSAPPGKMVNKAAPVGQAAHHHHTPTKGATAQPPPDQKQAARPVGQSRPTLLLMALLGVVMALFFYFRPPAAPTYRRQTGVAIITALALPVPVPPPRLLLSH